MTLIDRYLRAVKSNLASEERDDIISELAENIHAQIEDRASELGRALTDDEQAAVLKQLGNPMVVASRYRADQRTVAFGRQLIGPELFPLYARVLGINVAISIAVVLVRVLIDAGEGSAWSITYGLAVPLVFQLVIVTGVFIVIQRHFASTRDRWDPRSVSSGDEMGALSLESLSDGIIGRSYKEVVPRITSAIELAFLAIGLSWWLSGPPLAVGFMRPGPGWTEVHLLVTASFVAWSIPSLVSLVRPGWIRVRSAARIVADGVSVIVAGVSLAVGSWLVLVDPAAATADQRRLIEIIDTSIRVTLAAVVVISAISLVLELRRLLLMRPNS